VIPWNRSLFFDAPDIKKKEAAHSGSLSTALFSKLNRLFYLIAKRFKRFGLMHCEVGKYFAVHLDVVGMEFTHQSTIRQTVDTCGRVDTLDPQTPEGSLFGFAVAIGVLQTFFVGILGDGPNIFSSSKLAFHTLEDFLPPGLGCGVIY
jgi:hypothetical protein